MKKAFLGLFVILSLAVISCPNGDNLIEHTVTFNPDNGDAIFTIKVEDGKKVATPTEPTKGNYIFRGWFLGDTEFNFNTPITGNITLIAQWEAVGANNRTVTFKNGDETIDIIQVTVNTKIPAGDVPANPSKDGHDFDGWDFDIDNDDIIEDTTINALWLIKKFTIIFDVDGAETTIDNVEWGTVFNTLNIPTPEKANHTFTGWLPALPETVIIGETYTAQFTIKTYTVTFIINSVPTVRDNIAHGTAINTIDIPDTNRNGFNFTGWLPTLPEFVIADATYTAQYTAIEYITITWNLDGGNWQGAAPPTQIEKGETITKPTNPRKSGYRFLHWTTDPPDTEDPSIFNFDDPITQPITLRAVWEVIDDDKFFYWGMHEEERQETFPGSGDMGIWNPPDPFDINNFDIDKLFGKDTTDAIRATTSMGFNGTYGYPVIIVPVEFDPDRISNGLSNVKNDFVKYSINIDDTDYFIYAWETSQDLSAGTSGTLMTFILEFN